MAPSFWADDWGCPVRGRPPPPTSFRPLPDRVGACGFGDSCRAAGCHISYPIGSTTLTWELIQESPVPGPLPSAYVPGETYGLRLQLSDTAVDALAWGFELAPLMNLADLIVDIVDTGNTLRANGMEPIDEIASISSRLVVNKASMRSRHEPIMRVIEQLSAVLGER